MKKFILWFLKKLAYKLQSLLDEDYISLLKLRIVGDKAIIHKTARIFNHSGNIENIKIGNRTVIDGELLVFKYGGIITIGDYCYIGAGSRIWSGERIVIGNNVLISHNVNIIDTNSHEINHLERSERFKLLVVKDHLEEKGSIVTGSIVIEDDVWLSFNVSILKGVKIGKGAIIAAGTIITKDVLPFVMMGGNPAKIIKYLDVNESPNYRF